MDHWDVNGDEQRQKEQRAKWISSLLMLSSASTNCGR
jgi:hypothetical protein